MLAELHLFPIQVLFPALLLGNFSQESGFGQPDASLH
jgi:hypothetical protein